MKRLLLVLVTIVAIEELTFAQKGMAVAFVDEERVRESGDREVLQNFEYFYQRIQEVAKRDFPGIQLRMLKAGQLLRLPDGTGLNVQTMHASLGFVLSAKGRKRRVLTGIQSEADFACAAASFFRKRSPACPK